MVLPIQLERCLHFSDNSKFVTTNHDEIESSKNMVLSMKFVSNNNNKVYKGVIKIVTFSLLYL